MVCRGELDLDIEGLHELFEEVADKSIPIITDGHARDPEPLDILHEGLGDLGAGGLSHRDCFDPTAGPTEDRE